MNRWMTLALCALWLCVVTACGGDAGNAPANTDTTPPPANTEANKPAEPDKPDGPKVDPDKHLKIKGVTPEGWDPITKDGYTELLNKNFFKKPGAGIESVRYMGISIPKQPSPTAPAERWDGWSSSTLTAAVVFCVDKKKTDLKAALNRGASNLVNHFGEVEPQIQGDVAIAVSPNGRYVLAAFATEHGTYVVAGVTGGEEQEKRRQEIIAWAGTFKAE